MLSKPVRLIDEDFLAFVRSKTCSACGATAPDPHHLRTRGAGGSDRTCVPLCREHHSEWHTIGPSAFEEKYRVNLWQINATQLAEYFSDPVVIFRIAVRFMAGPDELPSEIVLALGQMLEELNRRAGASPRRPRHRRKPTRIPIG